MSQCEDFPCCGHTDGLGCDWVSPNEITPCPVCIDARKYYPYHAGLEGACPTIQRKKYEEAISLPVPAGFECEECGSNDRGVHSEFEELCFACGEDAHHYNTKMLQEQGYFDGNEY